MIRYDAFYLGKIVGTNRHVVIDMCNFMMVEMHDLCGGVVTNSPRFKFVYKDEEKGNAGDIRLINVIYNTKTNDIESKNGIKIDKYYKFCSMGNARFMADKREPMVLGKICNKLIVFIPGFTTANYRMAPGITAIENSLGRIELHDAESLYAIKTLSKPLNVKIVMAKDKSVYAQSYLGGIYEYFNKALKILSEKKIKANNVKAACDIVDSAMTLMYCADKKNARIWEALLRELRDINNLLYSGNKVDKRYYSIYNDLVNSLLSEDESKNFLNTAYVKSIIYRVRDFEGIEKIKQDNTVTKVKRESLENSAFSEEHNKILRNLKSFESGVKCMMGIGKYSLSNSAICIELGNDKLTEGTQIGSIEMRFVGPVLEEYKANITAYYSGGGLKIDTELYTVESDPMQVTKIKTIELDSFKLNNLDFAKIAGQHSSKYFQDMMEKYSKATGYAKHH